LATVEILEKNAATNRVNFQDLCSDPYIEAESSMEALWSLK
jgi:hypothetical protein